VRLIDTIRAQSWLKRLELNLGMAIRCWLGMGEEALMANASAVMHKKEYLEMACRY
jgi:hypothetical protein